MRSHVWQMADASKPLNQMRRSQMSPGCVARRRYARVNDRTRSDPPLGLIYDFAPTTQSCGPRHM
jgi:hypothetical protein